MLKNTHKMILSATAIPLLLAGCSQNAAPVDDMETADTSVADNAGTAMADDFVWPDSFRVSDEGYPNAGDTCRRVGESEATSDYIDHTVTLVGCPGDVTTEDARALTGAPNAKVVGQRDGVTIITIADTEMTEKKTAAMTGDSEKPLEIPYIEPGDKFDATAQINCKIPAIPRQDQCNIGVVREKDGSVTATIFWADKRTRIITFDSELDVMGADQNQADGSAKYKVKRIAKVHDIVVEIGPERYEINRSILVGG